MAGLGCKIGTKTVRFDDLTPAAWITIGGNNWSDAYLAPLRDLDVAQRVVVECVKVAEPDADPGARAAELTPTLRHLSELFVEVDDDQPNEFRDGVPTEGADG